MMVWRIVPGTRDCSSAITETRQTALYGARLGVSHDRSHRPRADTLSAAGEPPLVWAAASCIRPRPMADARGAARWTYAPANSGRSARRITAAEHAGAIPSPADRHVAARLRRERPGTCPDSVRGRWFRAVHRRRGEPGGRRLDTPWG